MILREDRDGVVLITQPAHAWLSGQIARQWGNGRFQRQSEAVCFAAEQHDVGFLPWDQEPRLNPETGWPYSFLELPTATHLEIWARGIQWTLRHGCYPALLVSRHFTEIGERTINGKSGEEQVLMHGFLDHQRKIQRQLASSLRSDVYYSDCADPAVIRRDQQFVSLVDWLSLMLCLKFQETRLQPPSFDGASFDLQPVNGDGTVVAVKPWPFRKKQIRFVCEGRELRGRFTSENALLEQLAGSPPRSLVFELRRK